MDAQTVFKKLQQVGVLNFATLDKNGATLNQCKRATKLTKIASIVVNAWKHVQSIAVKQAHHIVLNQPIASNAASATSIAQPRR